MDSFSRTLAFKYDALLSFGILFQDGVEGSLVE